MYPVQTPSSKLAVGASVGIDAVASLKDRLFEASGLLVVGESSTSPCDAPSPASSLLVPLASPARIGRSLTFALQLAKTNAAA
jgi:hypothetical protein